MLPWSAAFAGRLDEHVVDSVLLRDNLLGDPARRPLWVYVPPGYDGSPRHYPSVYVIQGYTGHLAMWRNRSPYRQPFPETADAMFAAGDVPSAVVASSFTTMVAAVDVKAVSSGSTSPPAFSRTVTLSLL